jgi:hypothetical protein
MHVAWAEPDRKAIRWTRRLLLVALVIAAVAIGVTLAMEDDPFFDLWETFLGILLIAGAIVFVGALFELVFRFVPRRARAATLAATLLPLLATAGALGLPQSAIHYSSDAGWAYRAGYEISLVPPVVAALIAAGIAFSQRQGLVAIAAVALLALSLSVLGRDLGIRSSEFPPDWCFADRVANEPGGVVSISGDDERCTLLLPQQDAF